jgi:hypothetical protein
MLSTQHSSLLQLITTNHAKSLLIMIINHRSVIIFSDLKNKCPRLSSQFTDHDTFSLNITWYRAYLYSFLLIDPVNYDPDVVKVQKS